MFNSFRTHYNRPKTFKKEPDEATSRNGLKPIRTFGRDIANLPTTSILMNERRTKHTKIDYSKNIGKIGWSMMSNKNDNQKSLRLMHDFENGNVASNGSSRPQKLDSKYINIRKQSVERNKRFKVIRQGPPKSKHHLYKRKIPASKENKGISHMLSNTNIKMPSRASVNKWSIRSSVGGIKPINISMKPRSMSRSQLGTGSNSRYKASITVATHLPILHNMSTASLLSNSNKQLTGDFKKSIGIVNYSNAGFKKKNLNTEK